MYSVTKEKCNEKIQKVILYSSATQFISRACGWEVPGISSACFNLGTQVCFGKMTEKYRRGVGRFPLLQYF